MSIFVLYNGQKKTIKVSPNTLMQQVLQEATIAFKIDNNNINNFVLKHKRNVINNSEPFRFANIPNNATLDLDIVDKNSNKINAVGSLTKVALSIEGTGSITGSYDSSLTLLQMIESLINEGKLSSNIISSSIELIYLRTSYKGQDELNKVTFTSLGLAGQSVRLQLRSNLLTNPSIIPPPSTTTTTTTTTTTEIESVMQIDNDQNSNLKDSSNIDDVKTIFNNSSMDVEKDDINNNNNDNDIQETINSMLTQNFDQVSGPAIITILKYIYNIIKYPDDSKYRTISTGNKAYIEKISNAKGVVMLLKVIGFSSVENSNPLSYVLNGDSSKIIPKLEQAELHLIEAMNKLQIPEDDRPKKQSVVPNRNQSIPINAFDPYKTAVIRNTPQPYRVESEVDKKLALINKRRLELEGDPNSVERLTEVCMPDDDNKGGHLKQSDDIDIDNTGEKSDSKIVARSIMNALKKSSDEAPLTTKAIRDLEKAQNEKVYSKTLIRIKFPDRVCVLGYFHPRHTTIDVYEWIYSCLIFENVDMKSKLLELYTSPPRFVLPLDKSLLELQLVPAALIHVSWTKKGQEALTNLPSSTIGSYLKESILSKSTDSEHSISIPSGEQLISSVKDSVMKIDSIKDETTIDSNADNKDSSNQDDSSKMKKPKWLNGLLK